MKFSLFVLVLLLTAPGLSGAEQQPLVREDFAFGMNLSISGEHAVYSLPLPAQVYQGCTRSDLGDLRVFSANSPVPHLLRPRSEKKNIRPSRTLPFFPLSSHSAGNSGPPHELRISAGSNGAIIDIRAGRNKNIRKAVTAYIVDASGLEHRANWLELTWSGQGRDFSTSVRVESSQDLNSWHTSVHAAALAELDFGGHRLIRRRIRLDVQGKYLRIAWPAGKDGVSLTEILAEYDREEQARSRTILSLRGKTDSQPSSDKIIWFYDSGGFFPIDQLHVRLPRQNSLARIAISSRADQQTPWRQRASLLAYRLTVDGTDLTDELRHIRSTTDRFWRLETKNIGSNEPPGLELGWLPGELLFVAQGEEPFTMVYGRTGLAAADYEMDRLLTSLDPVKEKKFIGKARTQKQIILGGKDMLEPAVEIPWKRWLLWAGLIFGVVAVGTMALQLFREMQREKK